MIHNHRFFHGEDGKIEYHEKNGEIWYSYREQVSIATKAHSKAYRTYDSEGIVSKKVVALGKEAIKRYTERRVEEYLNKAKAEYQRVDSFLRNPNYAVETQYEGVLLKGKIISADDNTLVVQLDEPYRGKDHVIYGWASAMGGRHILEGSDFSSSALATAKRLLIGIYVKEKHKEEYRDLIDLVEQLRDEK